MVYKQQRTHCLMKMHFLFLFQTRVTVRILHLVVCSIPQFLRKYAFPKSYMYEKVHLVKTVINQMYDILLKVHFTVKFCSY